MYPPFQTVTNLDEGAAILRARAYGVIEVADERLVAVRLRPWPKWGSLLETWWENRFLHQRRTGNRCWLYYNQPLGHRNFLTLMYVVSTRDTTMATMHGALRVLDDIARIKKSDAIMSHVTNTRISDRLLRREGWEQHCLDSPGRHFIKRFYGVYPTATATRFYQPQ